MATRTTPATGTDRQRLATATAGKFLASEAHTTSDHGRAWMGGTRSLTGAVYLGSVASQAAMLALYESGAKRRGCFEGDDCYRSDTLTWWKCIANNGKLISEWQEMSATASSIAASAVTYDHTISGLTASNAQAAIDELKTLIPAAFSGDAVDVAYNNTSSGMLSTDVQAAIDELSASAFSGNADDVAYDNTSSGLTATDVQAALDELEGMIGGPGSPAGSNTQIQFNNSGALGASSGLTWGGATSGLTVSGNSLAGANPTLKITDSNANEAVWARVEQTSVNAAFEFGVAGAAGQFFGDAHAGDGVFKGFLASPGMAIGGGAASPLTSLYIKYGGSGAKGRVIVGGVTDDGSHDLQVLDNAFIKNSLTIGNGAGAGPFLQINSSTYTLLQYARGGVSKFSTGTANGSNDFITGTVQDDIAFKSDASKSIHFSTDNGSSAALKLVASNGKAVFGNSIKTSTPSGGTAAEWKLGSQGTGVALALVATQYIELDIGGTLYKLALVT